MLTKVCKEITFDCAHMLSNHIGLCRNLHGHTYKVQISITADLIDRPKDSSEQMVIDFKNLKHIIQENIIDLFDHALLISNSSYRSPAEDALLEWATSYGMKFVELPGRTTAESMAAMIHNELLVVLLDTCTHLEKLTVRVYETPTSYAEV